MRWVVTAQVANLYTLFSGLVISASVEKAKPGKHQKVEEEVFGAN